MMNVQFRVSFSLCEFPARKTQEDQNSLRAGSTSTMASGRLSIPWKPLAPDFQALA
jgi:hypothetical protein